MTQAVAFLAPEATPRKIPRRAALVLWILAGIFAAAALGGPGETVPKPGPRRFPDRVRKP
ncbi:MAG: hypothetical protein POH28_13215 [Acidocella sp.]|nr:hypothetical protein [Acidocella sp.]